VYLRYQHNLIQIARTGKPRHDDNSWPSIRCEGTSVVFNPIQSNLTIITKCQYFSKKTKIYRDMNIPKYYPNF